MAYKIIWSRGGETAERYSSKALAKAILKKSNLSGRVVRTKLGSAGRTAPYSSFKYGDKESKNYPKGSKLKWHKSVTIVGGVHGFVYGKHR